MVRKGQGDVLVFPKRVVCARREDVHDVVFEFSHKAAQMDHTHTDRKEARRLWDAEKDRSWIKRTYGSIEELMEWIVDQSHSRIVRAVGVVIVASEYSIDIDRAGCNLFLHHFPHFSIHLFFSRHRLLGRWRLFKSVSVCASVRPCVRPSVCLSVCVSRAPPHHTQKFSEINSEMLKSQN